MRRAVFLQTMRMTVANVTNEFYICKWVMGPMQTSSICTWVVSSTHGSSLFLFDLNACSPTQNPDNQPHMGIVDSGASVTYIAPYAPIVWPPWITRPPLSVLVQPWANSWCHPPPEPWTYPIHSSFNHVLISVGKLCDGRCAVMFIQSYKPG